MYGLTIGKQHVSGQPKAVKRKAEKVDKREKNPKKLKKYNNETPNKKKHKLKTAKN